MVTFPGNILTPAGTWIFHISPRPAISPKTRSVGGAPPPLGIRAAPAFLRLAAISPLCLALNSPAPEILPSLSQHFPTDRHLSATSPVAESNTGNSGFLLEGPSACTQPVLNRSRFRGRPSATSALLTRRSRRPQLQEQLLPAASLHAPLRFRPRWRRGRDAQPNRQPARKKRELRIAQELPATPLTRPERNSLTFSTTTPTSSHCGDSP